MVVREFHEALARSPDTAVAVAAIKVRTTLHSCNLISCLGGQTPNEHRHTTLLRPECSFAAQALTTVIERSEATTMMGLEKELKEAAASLERQGVLDCDLLLLGKLCTVFVWLGYLCNKYESMRLCWAGAMRPPYP